MSQRRIWKKLLLFIAAPFLLCFGLLLFSILRSIYTDKVDEVQTALSYHAQFNQSHLLGKVDGVYMSIMTAANFLRTLDARHPDARKSGESALLVMLDNPDIDNAWLVYEPNAFDGRDAMDKQGYPGAPSGRFMRSFNRGARGPAVQSDMNESTVDDLLLSPRYAIVKQTGRPYISVNDDAGYDYRSSGGRRLSVSIATPIFRDGVFVGCVGGEILFDKMISRGEESLPIVSVLFSPDHQVRFAPDARDVGKSLDELGFSNVQIVKEAFRKAEPLFLSGESFHFTGVKSFVYFAPLRFKDFGVTSYLALGIPERVIDRALLPLEIGVVVALMVLLLVFLALLFYVGRLISRPIQALAQVAENASLDGSSPFRLETAEQTGEIGQITTAFLKMAASLQERIKDEHWSQEMLELHLMLEDGLYRGESFERLFHHAASRFAACFGAKRIALEQLVGSGVRVDGGGSALIVASYTPEGGLSRERAPALWVSLWANAADVVDMADAAAAEKPLVWRENTGEEREIVCALPIRTGGSLWGGLTLVFSKPLSETRLRHLDFIAAGMTYLLMAKKGAA
ncbi:hypothetical protein AGMMS49545_10310 [Betaproteobacteria bacterium]|nr:hypothetical protein AGMMS49545_10310 [Betaproteobacteria bacterium]GHU44333.1 hypothetical protein AGMMS50289_12390 [Betaproteobacteria bacterium]